jgi:hypothetical protein
MSNNILDNMREKMLEYISFHFMLERRAASPLWGAGGSDTTSES